MSPRIAVVIPTLNEEKRVKDAIASARAAGANEIVVSDGGSSDSTAAIGRRYADLLIDEGRMRSAQMNLGARRTSSEILLFLHADTLLPENAATVVRQAIENAKFGGFRLRFIERSARLRVAEWMINARSILFGEPWGDQAQFITRDLFEQLGGFREIALMEDYDLARRARKLAGSVIVREAVRTSGRRFLERGILRTTFTNWRIIAGYHRGESVEVLARRYRDGLLFVLFLPCAAKCLIQRVFT